MSGVHPDLSLTLPADLHKAMGFGTSTGTLSLDHSEPTSTLTPDHSPQQGTTQSPC